MRIRVLGGGLYGCHIALAMAKHGFDVVLHELGERLFMGASGNMPARLHCGAHYPRSKLTRDACQTNFTEFMKVYGDFTRGVHFNAYAVAFDSLLDFGTYRQILSGEIPVIPVERLADFGLTNVEGAVLTGERHVVVDELRDFFAEALKGVARYKIAPGEVDDPNWDLTVDATFCSHENAAIDRYEVCLTVLLEGPVDKAITIMDGPFPSLYPWDEKRGLCSLTSAEFTPMARFDSHAQARAYRLSVQTREIERQGAKMFAQMASYYPALKRDFRIVDHRLAIRAMPRSKADARLIDVVLVGDHSVRIRAGKIDAVFSAERVILAGLGK